MAPTSEKPKKWTRAKAPRVRTGCKTCKIRHLKCDEGKPNCLRCIKDGHVCDGYEVNPARKPKSKKSESPPSQESRALALRQKQTVAAPTSLPPRLIADVSRIPTEMDLFHHFRTCTVQDLGTALSPDEFWHLRALPLGHAVEPIKYAICALGGAHKRFKSQAMGLSPGSTSIQNLEEISIQQYNQAIHHIKEFTRTPSNSNMEVILTCCVIFICIETLLGRYAEALRHLQSGCALLESLRQLSPGTQSVDDSTWEKSNFFADITAMLARLGQDVAIYIGADVIPQLYFHLGPELKIHDPVTPFESVAAAAKSLFHIETEWSARIYAYEQDMTQGAEWNARIYTYEGDLAQPAQMDGMPMPLVDPWVGEKAFMDSIAPFYYNWCDRFDLFQQHVDIKTLSKQDQHRILTLSVERAVWSALLDLKSFEDDIPREAADIVVRRAEELVESDLLESMPVFAMDANLVPAMSLICTSCDDIDLQQRCINVLRRVRRREGIWDSQEIAEILESMMFAREKNLVSWGGIPWKVPQLATLMSQYSQRKAPKGIVSLAEEGIDCYWHGVKGVTY